MDREQSVAIEDKIPSVKSAWTSVPQGSVLGPSLFLI